MGSKGVEVEIEPAKLLYYTRLGSSSVEEEQFHRNKRIPGVLAYLVEQRNLQAGSAGSQNQVVQEESSEKNSKQTESENTESTVPMTETETITPNKDESIETQTIPVQVDNQEKPIDPKEDSPATVKQEEEVLQITTQTTPVTTESEKVEVTQEASTPTEEPTIPSITVTTPVVTTQESTTAFETTSKSAEETRIPSTDLLPPEEEVVTQLADQPQENSEVKNDPRIEPKATTFSESLPKPESQQMSQKQSTLDSICLSPECIHSGKIKSSKYFN